VQPRLQRLVELLESQAGAEPGIDGPKIDALLQPHPQLDGLYDSIKEALRDAITWLEGLEPEAARAPIGLEVSTRYGEWRTIRLPDLLLCPLPAA